MLVHDYVSNTYGHTCVCDLCVLSMIHVEFVCCDMYGCVWLCDVCVVCVVLLVVCYV